MSYHHASKTKRIRKNGGVPFALKLLSVSAAVIAAGFGCAKIPADSGVEVSTVTVEVIGGDADIFPGREFGVPVGGDTLLFIDAGREPNTRIAGIWVDGGKMCCAGDGAVRDTGIALFGVGGGVVVVVELAKIDTVQPSAELVSPAPAAAGDLTASITTCSFGAIEYRLNKAMANGYIKWGILGEDGSDDKDSLRVVRIPGDITKYGHEVGGWSYTSPDGYLSEGLQKFDLAVSPIAGKRISRGQIAVPALYFFELRFTDSLGNASVPASRAVWTTAVDKDCP